MEIVEVKPLGARLWEVVLLQPNGHHTYRVKNRDHFPDELSAYMAVASTLTKEQTNGTHT